MIRLLGSLLLLSACTLGLRAEVRTLTDQFGRSITADVIELDGDTLKIRRDDGIVFDLPIGNLALEDQKAIRKWAAAQPKKVEAEFEPDPKYIILNFSRVKLSSQTQYQYEGYKHSHELWGYNIQLTNKHLRIVDGLRIEYNVLANTYSDLGTQRPITGSKTLDPMRTNDVTNMKTKGAEVCKRRSIDYGNSGGEVKGVWIRVYYKDKIVHEVCSPEGLKDTESWTRVEN